MDFEETLKTYQSQTITDYYDGVASTNQLEERRQGLLSSWSSGQPAITSVYDRSALEPGGVWSITGAAAEKMLVAGTGSGAVKYLKLVSGHWQQYKAFQMGSGSEAAVVSLDNSGPNLLVGSCGKREYAEGTVHICSSPLWQKGCAVSKYFTTKYAPWSYILKGKFCIVGCSGSTVEVWDTNGGPIHIKSIDFSPGYPLTDTCRTMVYQAPRLWVANDGVTVLTPASSQEVEDIWDADFKSVKEKPYNDYDFTFPSEIDGQVVVAKRFGPAQVVDFADGEIQKVRAYGDDFIRYPVIAVAMAGQNCRVTGSYALAAQPSGHKEIIDGHLADQEPWPARKAETVICPVDGKPQRFFEHERHITSVYVDACFVVTSGEEGNVIIYDYRPGQVGNKERSVPEAEKGSGCLARGG
ncbi:MAG: hypothetical protein M1814_000488 [Vezdaea aestivalis]|nr:MAG: hypothetical protein M1814_000488 [Vezdaea aestivalis]